MKEGYHNTRKDTKKKGAPKPRYRSRVEFDFLKYIRIVFRWATENYDLNRPDIELMLYLYPQGAFSKKQFMDYYKTMRLFGSKRFKELIDDGWIMVWRPKKGKQHALYVLTHKTKTMCNKMHKYCAGLEDIPVNEVSNDMAAEGKPRINNYYLDIIKKMNKDKATDE